MKSGIYSVETGYELATYMEDKAENQPILAPSMTTLKAKVWKVKTSKKIKHFL